MATLKTILNNVLAQSGFLERGSFTSANDPDDKQMVAISNRVAYEIMNFWKWPELRNSFQVNIKDAQTRYNLPDDYQDLVPNSAWETDGEREVEFPVADSRWFMYKFTTWSDGGTIRVRKYGNEIEIHDPVGGESFQFEYVSKWPVLSEAGVRKEFFDNDTDTWVLDDQLLVLGIQAHWMQTKLMPQYMEHFGNYNRKMAEAIGRANAGSTIGGVNASRLYGFRSPYYPLYRPSNG